MNLFHMSVCMAYKVGNVSGNNLVRDMKSFSILSHCV